MIEGEGVIFNQLDRLPIAELKRHMEVGCRRIFLRIHNQNISEQSFDYTRSAPNESAENKWRHILRNSLVTVWKDSQDGRIVDRDVLFEQVLGIAEAIEHSGYDADEALALISEFSPESEL